MNDDDILDAIHQSMIETGQPTRDLAGFPITEELRVKLIDLTTALARMKAAYMAAYIAALTDEQVFALMVESGWDKNSRSYMTDEHARQLADRQRKFIALALTGEAPPALEHPRNDA